MRPEAVEDNGRGVRTKGDRPARSRGVWAA